jgi:hypothetical protein
MIYFEGTGSENRRVLDWLDLAFKAKAEECACGGTK